MNSLGGLLDGNGSNLDRILIRQHGVVRVGKNQGTLKLDDTANVERNSPDLQRAGRQTGEIRIAGAVPVVVQASIVELREIEQPLRQAGVTRRDGKDLVLERACLHRSPRSAEQTEFHVP